MKPTTRDFIDGVIDTGREVEDYVGRGYWRGPAVRADDERDLVEIIRATGDVPLQWDTLGFGWIVYPINSDPEWFDTQQGNENGDMDDEI